MFDETNVVAASGVVPAMALAEAAGFSELTAKVTVPSAAVVAKLRTVVAGMLAGADCIDDLDVLRSGGMARVVGGVRAPSTIGTFLRTFTHGHALQLTAVNKALLAGLAAQVPTLIGRDDLVFVDVDDTIREVHGYQKQGAAFGYSGVRGLNALVTTISTPSSAPVIAGCSLRKGNTRSGKGAAWHLARTFTQTAALTNPGQQVWVRGDSAFCTLANVSAATRAGAWFSFTIPSWKNVPKAISQIPQDAWTPIEYPNAIRDDETGALISEAEVAEIDFAAFTSRGKKKQVPCRLIVRRVRRLGDAPANQEGLFEVYRHHAFITNTTLGAVEADAYHRGHAIIAQVIAELKDGPLAHLPSGNQNANAAWLTCAVIAFNLSRAVAHAAGIGKSRMASAIRKIINVPAHLANSGRRLVIHLPAAWPWQDAWTNLWDNPTGTPGTCAT